MARTDKSKRVIVRQYGLLEPLNWDQDCMDHLSMQNNLWNTLVEIEHKHQAAYRSIVSEDKALAEVNRRIQHINDIIATQKALRKEARSQHRARVGDHTKHFDEKIKELKDQVRALSPLVKELRLKTREQKKEALAQLEPQRKQAVNKARQNSGLWWGNYNAVIDAYHDARVCAMKAGRELRFHRFDGSGSFRCQAQGGMTVEELLSAKYNIAQIQMVDHDTFAELRGGVGNKSKQAYGSRNYKRGYGVLSIIVYTYKDNEGKAHRRTLDFPIILHRPLPTEAILKEIRVRRKRIGTDFRWDVTFTFNELAEPIIHPHPEKRCSINFGWKAVKGGLRVATIFDDDNTLRHIVMPQVIVDKLAYVNELQSRIDKMTNMNSAWLLEQLDDHAPEPLVETLAPLVQAKRPHPTMFSEAVTRWQEHESYLPEVLEEANRRRRTCLRLSREQHHLRNKVIRRRQDFYRCQAKKIAETYGIITMRKLDLRQLALLEKGDGQPTIQYKEVRHSRTVAAVSVLREWIVKQATKAGAQVNIMTITPSATCHNCGTQVKSGPDIVQKCLDCGASWDQEENAAINLLRAMEL